MKIMIQIALLYAFAWLGGAIQQWLHLSIPGSIIGLLLLFVLLVCRIVPVTWIETGSKTILFYLPLFFVPATVGVMNHLDLFAGKGLLLVAVIIASTIITIIVAGHISQSLAKWSERGQQSGHRRGQHAWTEAETQQQTTGAGNTHSSANPIEQTDSDDSKVSETKGKVSVTNAPTAMPSQTSSTSHTHHNSTSTLYGKKGT
ncbi:CidA/LrgA family protein [Paenibacillus campi]|uniref:CidA/LrgA family protein n=1 Tax=Paenibacillus campi TaxID=3106031 RepID=UPI002AFFEF1F|nr:CidA/LrgA family protein [Paenibacillus sp. SGZ-1009]